MVIKQLREELPEGALVFDNASYDNSIIGYTLDNRIVYDYDSMVEEFMIDNDCSMEEAIEWIDFNTIRSLPYAGENAPIIIYSIENL